MDSDDEVWDDNCDNNSWDGGCDDQPDNDDIPYDTAVIEESSADDGTGDHPSYAVQAHMAAAAATHAPPPDTTPSYKRPRLHLPRGPQPLDTATGAPRTSSSLSTSSTATAATTATTTATEADSEATCPHVELVYPRVLARALAIHHRNEPDQRFLKRMKIEGKVSCSITSFLIVQTAAAEVDEDELDAFVGAEDDQFCELCNVAKVMEPSSAQSVCLTCGEAHVYQVPDTSFREGVSIHTPYLYKRSNHFRDHLKRVQGRESTQIEPEVLERISQELAKTYKPDELCKVTPANIRLILKQLGLSRLYNHTTRIWSLTTDQAPLMLTQTQEAELLHFFQMVQKPWESLRPEGRSNMLSYSYLIHKMARILGYDDVASHFRLLKSKEKLRYQDTLWKTICQELGFKFQRSV